MKSLRTAALSVFVLLSFTTIVHSQAPICDVTCSPDPGSPTYAGAVAARPKMLNARGSSSILQVNGGPEQAPMVIGSQSYNYVIPILNLPGRAGMDLNLSLYYNSRIWNVDTVNGIVTFNADRDFPAYGFRLGFGYLEYDPTFDEYVLTEKDGTKRSLPNSGGYNSIDGSVINFDPTVGILTYKNGTTVQYVAFPSNGNLFRPVQIKDTNGNYISISYGTSFDQQILSITDTLGRVINFHYTSSLLTSIDQTLLGGGTHLWATFTWTQIYGGGHVWQNFAPNLLVGAVPDTSTPLNVLASCTYANLTGYAFSYGDWAIINTIQNLSSSSPAKVRSYVSYNYPLASAGALSDAPTYTQQTISPDNTSTSVWNYAVSSGGTGVVTAMQITDPLGGIQATNLDPPSGLPVSAQTKDSSGNILRTVAYTWTTSGGANVPNTVSTTLENGLQSSVVYANYDAFGNPADVYEYDFGGALLRHTVTTYATTRFGPQHILNLPTQVLIKNAGGTNISRMDFDYDTTSVTNITDAPQHDNSLTVHGNSTLITRYSDPVTPAGSVVRHLFYDSTGNVRTAEVDCCNQKVFNYSLSQYKYAYPDSIVSGPTGGIQFTTTPTWSRDFGLVLTHKDENNQSTSYQYDSMNRLTSATMPPQGSTSVQFTTAYDDGAQSPAITKAATPSSATVPKTVTTFDGLGHALRADTYNGSTLISSITTSYDKLWRPSQVSNPFAPGDTAVYTGFSYDALGRTKQVTPPSSGNTQYSYSGNSVTVTDPASKIRKTYNDALGRLIQVDEAGIVSDHTPANNYATLQTDGNFVLYDPFNNPLWSTGTYGTNASAFYVQDDGNLVLYIFKWQAGVYVAPTGGTIPYDGCRVGSSLFATQILASGACLESPSGRYMLLMQSDGNLFIYDRSVGQVTWAANTHGHPGAYASLQSDGNFVVYDINGIGIWSSGTYGTFSERLDMGDDGRIIIYKSAWNSGTSTGNFNQTTIAHPACDVGTGTGWTGVLGTGSCFVSPNGRYELLMQTDGNLVLSNVGVAPVQILWSTNTALTPVSLDVAFHTYYTYDPLGNLTASSLGNITGQANSGQSRNYAYDGLSRPTTSTTPESGTVTNFYTTLSGGSCGASAPALVCRTQDARGIVKNFTYDAFNRMTALQYTNTAGGTDPFNTPSISYQYDQGGAAAFALTRLTSITEGPGAPTPVNSHSFTYDNLGRMTKDTQSIDQQTYLVQYAYNLASEVASTTYPSGRVVVQTYDSIGRPCSVGASGSTCTSGTRYLNSLTYNAAGETLGLTLGNGVQGNFTYNDHLQLASLRYSKTGSSTDILNLGYDFTSAGQQFNNGQIQAMHYFTQPNVENQTKSESFTYDQLGRLKAAQTITVNGTAGTWSLQWTYDRFGNRLSQALTGGNVTIGQPTFTINAQTNRITGYTYDLAGNITNDAVAAYAYDGASRLTGINGNAALYTYFAQQRIKKILGSTTSRYIYSGGTVIAEYVNGAQPTNPSVEYIYAGSRLLATIAGSSTTYHHADHLSNRAETNSSGTVARTFGHFPFGETWYETGTADKWKFTFYERDSGTGETGLDYAGFRYRSSGQGRFMSPDRLGGRVTSPQSLNGYTYGLNDPVNVIDRWGLNNDCGGPCTDFSGWIGGCFISVTYSQISVQEPNDPDDPTAGTHTTLYDMPTVSGFCSGGVADPVVPYTPGLESQYPNGLCNQLPDGRVVGTQSSAGAVVNAVAGTEIVTNWNTGEQSKFYYIGTEKGVAATSYSGYAGAIFNLGNSNSSYSGPFVSGNVAGEKLGVSTAYSVGKFGDPGTITTGPSTITLTAGAGLSPVTLSTSSTIYTEPTAAGNLFTDPHPFTGLGDYLMYGLRSALGCNKKLF